MLHKGVLKPFPPHPNIYPSGTMSILILRRMKTRAHITVNQVLLEFKIDKG
jgi:ubiquitin-protein ligase